MNPRKKSCLDSLMKGSEVPQPEWYYFLEMEKITEKHYKRMWFYLDNICQREHDHIPETLTIGSETIIKRVKKTRSQKLKRLLYNKVVIGLTVELDNESPEQYEDLR